MSSEQTGPGLRLVDPGLAAETRHQPDPSSLAKLTRGTSCVLCQQRKVRCDKSKPCANCVKAGVECRVVPPQPPRRRKKRLQERDLVDRLRKYEALLAENGVKFDAIGHELRTDGPQHEDVEELENDFEALKTSPNTSVSPSATSNLERPGRSIFSLRKEFRVGDELLHDSSEDEADESTIHRAFDKMFSNNDGFPFVFSGRQQTTTHYHPSTIHIFQLWQIYIDNINILLKITHVPSIQGQIIQASSNLESAPKNIEALMFGIYSMAVTSMDDEDVEKMFSQSKSEVLAQFFEGLQQALLNVGFMRTSDIISLQAFLLYLFAIRWFVDPRQVFCLIGIAVRIAQRMGLHRDPAGYGLPPMEVEQRRRLWWTIVSYDRRIAEMTGSTITSISSGGDCKLPLNVNDSDLHTDGKELPSPHTGPTEMLFALTRLEMAMAVANNYQFDGPGSAGSSSSPSSWHPKQQGRSAAPAAASIRIAGQDMPPYTLDGFCAHMENTYLQHCDPKIPLHFFTITMTRQTLSKMRVLTYLMRVCGAGGADSEPLSATEADNMFLLSVQMIEYDNAVHATEGLKPFRWFIAHHFPFPAYVVLIQELRRRCHGAVVERAWEAIAANHQHRRMMHNFHSPMHTAFGRHFIKAWDAHVEACVANSPGGQPPATPLFITILRAREDERRRARMENRPEVPGAEGDQPPYDLPRPGAQDASPDMDANIMMTPPGASAGGSSGGVGIGPTPVQDTSDMDWSYLVSNFQPGVGLGYGFQGFQSFGPYGPGPGINRMGGMGGAGPGGMY